MSLKSRIFAAAGTLGAAVAVAAFVATPAGAGINTNAVQVVGDGSAGFSLTHSEPYSNAGADLVPTKLALNIGNLNGGLFTGGLGLQLCDPNNGFGLQVGEVANPDGKTMAVKFAVGTLVGAAADNCVGNGLLPVANKLQTTTLDAISPIDHIQVFASFKNVKHTYVTCTKKPWHCVTHHVHRGRVKFQAQDLTSGFEIYSSGWIHTKADWNLTEAGFGVQQNVNGLSADTPLTCPNGTASGPAGVFSSTPNTCSMFGSNPLYDGVTGPNGTGAHSLLAQFSEAFVNGDGLGLPPFGGPPFIFTSTIHEVATAGNGLDSNPATAAPNNSGHFFPNDFSFNDYVGNVVS